MYVHGLLRNLIRDDLEETMIAGSTAAVLFGRASTADAIAKCVSNIANDGKVQKKLQVQLVI